MTNDDLARLMNVASGSHDRSAILQPIVGYHTDECGHWVAQLACGHHQHVRHDPPMVQRIWVVTNEGRDSMLGFELSCKKCADHEPTDER